MTSSRCSFCAERFGELIAVVAGGGGRCFFCFRLNDEVNEVEPEPGAAFAFVDISIVFCVGDVDDGADIFLAAGLNNKEAFNSGLVVEDISELLVSSVFSSVFFELSPC